MRSPPPFSMNLAERPMPAIGDKSASRARLSPSALCRPSPERQARTYLHQRRQWTCHWPRWSAASRGSQCGSLVVPSLRATKFQFDDRRCGVSRASFIFSLSYGFALSHDRVNRPAPRLHDVVTSAPPLSISLDLPSCLPLHDSLRTTRGRSPEVSTSTLLTKSLKRRQKH